MYLMYVDDSGDCGMPVDGSPSKLFCLSGVVVHELRWRDTLAEFAHFRRWLAIIRNFADEIAALPDLSIINVVVDKQSGRVPNKDEVFRWAWYSLFQRFENTIRYQHFPGPCNPDDRGMVFPDNTDGKRRKSFLDRMRVRNHMKIRQNSGAFVYKDEPIRIIIEDPVLRDSRESYFIQAADCAAFLLKQHIDPSPYMKRHGGNAYLKRLDPVLCKHASNKDPAGKGIVRL